MIKHNRRGHSPILDFVAYAIELRHVGFERGSGVVGMLGRKVVNGHVHFKQLLFMLLDVGELGLRKKEHGQGMLSRGTNYSSQTHRL